MFQGAQILGPMVGGLIYGVTGSPAPVYAGSVVADAWRAMALMAAVRVERRASGDAASRGVLEGLRYLWRTKLVLGAISLDMFAVLLGGAVALLPVFAKDILHVGADGTRHSARRARRGRGDHGAGGGASSARPARGRGHAVVRRGLRRVHGGVRAFAKL